jgi:hypothetical protein
MGIPHNEHLQGYNYNKFEMGGNRAAATRSAA